MQSKLRAVHNQDMYCIRSRIHTCWESGVQDAEDAVTAEGRQHDGIAGEQTPSGQMTCRKQACSEREESIGVRGMV